MVGFRWPTASGGTVNRLLSLNLFLSGALCALVCRQSIDRQASVFGLMQLIIILIGQSDAVSLRLTLSVL